MRFKIIILILFLLIVINLSILIVRSQNHEYIDQYVDHDVEVDQRVDIESNFCREGINDQNVSQVVYGNDAKTIIKNKNLCWKQRNSVVITCEDSQPVFSIFQCLGDCDEKTGRCGKPPRISCNCKPVAGLFFFNCQSFHPSGVNDYNFTLFVSDENVPGKRICGCSKASFEHYISWKESDSYVDDVVIKAGVLEKLLILVNQSEPCPGKEVSFIYRCPIRLS